jgi:hypothetical protein
MKELLIFVLLITTSGFAVAQQRSYREKAEFMTHHPCPSTGKVKIRYGCKGYVIDHVDPLACGGEDKAYNMQWQTVKEAKEKDKWERKDCHKF